MGVPGLSQAESEYFKSGGTVVADSLKQGLPAEPIAPVKGHNEADVSHKTQSAIETKPTEIKPVETKPTETDEQKAKADREARRKAAIDEFGLVDLGALQEARNETKTLKQQQAELTAWKQQIEPLLAQLKPASKPTEQNPYDPTVQPQEYKQYQDWIDTKQAAAEYKAFRQQWDQSLQQQQNIQRAAAWSQAQEAEYAKTQPAYPDAYKYAVEHRTKELQAMGASPEQIQATIYQDQAQIVGMAMQTGKNPAEIIWNLAQARGFAPKAPENKSDPAITAMQKIAAGQAASGGLNGGAAPKGEMTLEDVARMPIKTPEQRKAYDAAFTKAMKG